MGNLRPNVSRFTVGEGLPASKYRRDDRVKCLECRDYGWVSIWHPRTLQQAAKDPDATIRKKCVVRCNCDAPGPKVFKGKSKGPDGEHPPIPVFGTKDWHISTNGPEAKAEAAAYVYRPPNYNEAFEQFESPKSDDF